MYKLKRILYATILISLGLALLASLPYYYTKIYHFNKSEPFSGDQFYNPYSNLSDSWLKANFHAHSKLFLGLTNGENTEDEMKQKYQSLNFDIASLSNYNSITEESRKDSSFTVYEHGMNLGFTHQLVFNSEESSYFDFPLFQNLSQKQMTINELKDSGSLIALAHPDFKWGYNLEDYNYLKNYDLMEVVSVRKKSLNHWDAALSAGKVVWGIGNDDSHDTTDSHCGVVWNKINTNDINNDTILRRLQMGTSYFVKGWQGIDMLELKEMKVSNDTLKLLLSSEADSITLISDSGKTVKTATNSSSIEYKIDSTNTYVRAEAFISRPWNTYTKLYFNPVIRVDSNNILEEKVQFKVDELNTFLYYLLLLIVDALLIAFMVLVIKKWKRTLNT